MICLFKAVILGVLIWVAYEIGYGAGTDIWS